jgi:hypothetical protein
MLVQLFVYLTIESYLMLMQIELLKFKMMELLLTLKEVMKSLWSLNQLNKKGFFSLFYHFACLDDILKSLLFKASLYLLLSSSVISSNFGTGTGFPSSSTAIIVK